MKQCIPVHARAYARRETMELLRDPIRMTFAFIGSKGGTVRPRVLAVLRLMTSCSNDSLAGLPE